MRTSNYRKIGEIRKDLKVAKHDLRSVVNAAGDDMGCDGSFEHAQQIRWEISSLESELEDALNEKKQKAN